MLDSNNLLPLAPRPDKALAVINLIASVLAYAALGIIIILVLPLIILVGLVVGLHWIFKEIGSGLKHLSNKIFGKTNFHKDQSVAPVYRSVSAPDNGPNNCKSGEVEEIPFPSKKTGPSFLDRVSNLFIRVQYKP
jgi:hypothetical protein